MVAVVASVVAVVSEVVLGVVSEVVLGVVSGVVLEIVVVVVASVVVVVDGVVIVSGVVVVCVVVLASVIVVDDSVLISIVVVALSVLLVWFGWLLVTGSVGTSATGSVGIVASKFELEVEHTARSGTQLITSLKQISGAEKQNKKLFLCGNTIVQRPQVLFWNIT